MEAKSLVCQKTKMSPGLLAFALIFAIRIASCQQAVKVQPWNCQLTQRKGLNPELSCSESNKTKSVFTFSLANRVYNSLRITNKNFECVSDFAFKNVTASELDLSFNKMEYFTNRSLIGLNLVKKLTLRENKFKTIDSLIAAVTLANINILENLYLDNNQIEKIEVNFTSSFRALQRLFFPFNQLEFIQKNALDNLTMLNYLQLQNNKFKTIADFGLSFNLLNISISLFASLNQIEEVSVWTTQIIRIQSLSLYQNGIVVLKPNAFSIYPGLKRIELSANKISTLDFAFVGLKELKILDLSRNFIETITVNAFPDLVSLTQMFLYSNWLTRIKDDSFLNNGQLVKINLAYNRLQFFTNRHFERPFLFERTRSEPQSDKIL
jgi:Leucine-rich repeat (LRR) protein